MNNLISFFIAMIFLLCTIFGVKIMIKTIQNDIKEIINKFHFAKELILSINEDKTHYL